MKIKLGAVFLAFLIIGMAQQTCNLGGSFAVDLNRKLASGEEIGVAEDSLTGALQHHILRRFAAKRFVREMVPRVDDEFQNLPEFNVAFTGIKH